MPKDFSHLKKITGWDASDAEKMLGVREVYNTAVSARSNPKESEEALRALATEYLEYFKAHPEKTHLFPMVGANFQHDFARGVADAAHKAGIIPKVRLRTITTFRTKGQDFLNVKPPASLLIQTEKLKLREPVVLHDSVLEGMTVRLIGKAIDAPVPLRKRVVIHRLTDSQVKRRAEVPVLGKRMEVGVGDMAKKSIDPDGRVRLVPKEGLRLSERQRAFIRQSLYATGVAATREMLDKTKKE